MPRRGRSCGSCRTWRDASGKERRRPIWKNWQGRKATRRRRGRCKKLNGTYLSQSDRRGRREPVGHCVLGGEGAHTPPLPLHPILAHNLRAPTSHRETRKGDPRVGTATFSRLI